MSGIHIDSTKATETSAPRPGAIIEVKPAPPIKKIEDEHRQRRFFLGPMPNNVASGEVFSEPAAQNLGIGKKISLGIRKRFSLASQHRRSLSSEDSVSRERAYLYFISKGGRPEEFESKEKSVKAEILWRVRDTRWFESASAGAQDPNAAAKRWVGDTFEIGKDVLGLSMLVPEEEEPPVIGRTSVSEGFRGTATSPEENAVSFSKILGATVESTGSKTSASKPESSKAPASTKSKEGDEHRETPRSHGTADSPEFASNNATAAEGSKTRLLSPSPLPGSSSSVNLSRPGALDPSKRQDVLSESTSRREITSSTPSSKKGSESPKLSKSKGKGKEKVKFKDEPDKTALSVPTPQIEALSPTEVLTREPSSTTSAGAVARMQEELLPDDESGILMRDRMLVRVLSTPSAIQKYLDEQQLLEMHETRKDRNTMWREYLVVWKRRCVELYEPYTLPGKEWVAKHKHLAFKIPLITTKTTLSVFSHVDMSICLTCPKPSAHSHLPDLIMSSEDKQTTLIFIMKTKSRSRAVDWIWRLWRTLGGTIPDSIEIRCPVLEARVNFPIPAVDPISGAEGYRIFTRDNVIQNCREQMSGIPEWDILIESALRQGNGKEPAKLELSWRTDSKLDWAWLQEDVNGLNRPWSVLFGLAVNNPRTPADLELRVAEHFPTNITLENHTTLHEPPSIEGYLYRYKTETHLRDPVYLASHNGNIFFLNPNSAHPPRPPTTTLLEDDNAGAAVRDPAGSVAMGRNPPDSSITRTGEVQRGAAQILNAKSFLDMRNITSVRRAAEVWTTGLPNKNKVRTGSVRSRHSSATSRRRTHSTTTNATTTECHTHDHENIPEQNPAESVPSVDRDPEDIEIGGEEDAVLSREDELDEGGDDVLDKLVGNERDELKKRRSFEIVMRTQEVIRFEAYSCKVCVEWITRLRSLVAYWTRKQRVDARLEMDIVHALSGRTRFLVPGAGENVYPAPPPDPRSASPLLGAWWHWCVLNGCRSIVRAGRLFMRTAARGEMRHYYFVLVAGHLIRFRLTSSGARPISVLHHHAHTVNLLDAYVTSGHFAALELDEGNKVFEPTARRFQDGLETDDRDMDTLIIIRYRNLPVDHSLKFHGRASMAPDATGATTAASTKATKADIISHGGVPALDSRHNILVLRARSKLERDAWCWALNAEIERLVRLHSPREEAVRNNGRIR